MTNHKKRRLIIEISIAILCIAIAICMYLYFSVSFYRARGIDSNYLSDTQITLTPWKTFSCNLRGEKHSGKYDIVCEAQGNKYYYFYDKNGTLLFKAFYTDKELIYDKTYFVKVN